MTPSRLNQLLQFLKEDPADPFLLYAVALEYTNTDTSQALLYFERLLKEHPDYLATYYQAALLWAALGEKQKADWAFKTGIDKAREQKNTLALRELQNAYNEFLFET